MYMMYVDLHTYVAYLCIKYKLRNIKLVKPQKSNYLQIYKYNT